MPQKYKTCLLKEAYERFEKHYKLDELSSYTDDADLLNRVLGIQCKMLKGLEQNIKITTPLDITIAHAINAHIHGGNDE